MPRRRLARPRPFDRLSADLRGRIRDDERFVAEGRVDEIDPVYGPTGATSGSGHDYLVLTDRRLLVMPRGGRQYELDLVDVTQFAERTIGHRLLLRLHHAPTERRRHRPRHNILWMHWGNREQTIAEEETYLRFSRPETAAAQALVDQLVARGVPRVPVGP